MLSKCFHCSVKKKEKTSFTSQPVEENLSINLLWGLHPQWKFSVWKGVKVISHVSSPGMINLALGGWNIECRCVFSKLLNTRSCLTVWSRSLQDHRICYLQYILGYVVLTTLDPQIAFLDISGQDVCTAGVFHTHGLSRPGVSCCPYGVASRASALEASVFHSSALHGLKFYQERNSDNHCLKSSGRRSLTVFLRFVREHNLKAAGGMKVRHHGG